MLRHLLSSMLTAVLVLVGVLAFAPAAAAANCSIATAQGSTGPANWQTYCWIDMSAYNDTTAHASGGQNFALTMQDGTVVSFNLTASGVALNPVAAPSWSGAAIGNTAFTGISGKPVLYQPGSGTTRLVISNITLTPPAGVAAVTQYMFVAGDGESTNDNESLQFVTNGGNWLALDQAGPTSGSTYPTQSGIGTNTYTVTGVPGTVGAYIVGTSTPTTLTSTLVGGGLEGVMFALRFASIRLNTVISGARVTAADQFTFNITSTSGGAGLASGTSSGAGLGPFTAAALSSTSAIPLTLVQAMAAGSTSSLTHYRSVLSCTNGSSSSTPLPSGVITASYSFGSMQFGDAVQCTYTETPFPHATLTKALAASGRQYPADQFTVNIDQGATNVATAATTGSGAAVSTGTAGPVQLTAALPYKFYETGAGVTSLAQYTAALACTNANASSATTLPSVPGGTLTPAMGDVVSCTLTNTRIAANAQLTILKSASLVSDPVDGTTNPKYIPGAVVRYTFNVSNSGPSAVDNNTVVLIDTLPSQLRVGTSSSPVFTQGSPSSGLTFTAGTDIKYANTAVAPANFAACNYTPVSAYDPLVKYVCLNPKGAMAGSTGTPPSFSLSIQAQLN